MNALQFGGRVIRGPVSLRAEEGGVGEVSKRQT